MNKVSSKNCLDGSDTLLLLAVTLHVVSTTYILKDEVGASRLVEACGIHSFSHVFRQVIETCESHN